MLLLHLLAGAVPRPQVRVVHVEHGLRGDEGRADARFCANLCRALAIPLLVRTLDLEPSGPSVEARARSARYTALIDEARRTSHRTILTGHHSDDALETLLWRWVRGSALAGLRGPRADLPIGAHGAGAAPVRIVRPLLPLRREEVRRLLADRGLTWREDRSNVDGRFTRNRLRHGFLPFLRRICGEEGIENLRAFGRAVEDLEDRLAAVTAHLAWSPAPYAPLSRGPDEHALGGVLRRCELMVLAPPLRRRALWRLLIEGTGEPCGRGLLDRLLGDLRSGRCTRHSLPGDWTLLFTSNELHLLPPRTPRLQELEQDHEPCLPFPLESSSEGAPHATRLAELLPFSGLSLRIPGIVTLPDGRRVSAERVHASRSALPTSFLEAELDADGLPDELLVRWPRPGDRFQALGAPGSKPLLRFLADRKIPREERLSIPVVYAEREALWVAGVELAEQRRVRPETRARLRLTLHPGSPLPAAVPATRRRLLADLPLLAERAAGP